MSVAAVQEAGSVGKPKQGESEFGDEQLVVFNLGEEQFGVDIAKVQEIIRWQKVTKVPNAPEYVEGVINLRSRIVPVIDLRRRFGLPAVSQDKETRIVVMEIRGQTVGTIVDGVSEVLQVSGSLIEPPSPIITTTESTHLRGIARMDDSLIALLDLEQVLTTGELACCS